MNAAGEHQRYEWVEIMEPHSQNIMYVNLITGDYLLKPPVNVTVKTMDKNQWWELYDSNTNRFYYYNPFSLKTVWQKPFNTDIIPLAKLQNLRQHTEVEDGTISTGSLSSVIGNLSLNDRKSVSNSAAVSVRKEIATQTPPPAAAPTAVAAGTSEEVVCDSSVGTADWRQCSTNGRQRDHYRRHYPKERTVEVGQSVRRSCDREPIYYSSGFMGASVSSGTNSASSTLATTLEDADVASRVQRCPSQQSMQTSWSSGQSTLNRVGLCAERNELSHLDDTYTVSEGSLDSGIPDNNSWDSLDSNNPTEFYYQGAHALSSAVTASTMTGTPQARHKSFPRTNPAYVRPRMGIAGTAPAPNTLPLYGTSLPQVCTFMKNSNVVGVGNNVSPPGSSRCSVLTDDTVCTTTSSLISGESSSTGMAGSRSQSTVSLSSASTVESVKVSASNVLQTTPSSPAPVTMSTSKFSIGSSVAPPIVPSVVGVGSSAGNYVVVSLQKDHRHLLKRQGSEPGLGFASALNRPQSMLITNSHGHTSSLPPGANLPSHQQLESRNDLNCHSAISCTTSFRLPNSRASHHDHPFLTNSLDLEHGGLCLGPQPGWALALFSKSVQKDVSRLNFTKESITKSMLHSTDKALKKDACELFKQIQMYMCDRKNKHQLSSGELAYAIVHRGWRLRGLRDELFMQLCKQTTNNLDTESLLRGWELLCVALTFFPPSSDFQAYLEGYLLRHVKELHVLGLSRYPQIALRRLQRISLSGARRGSQPPSLEEILLSKSTILSPSIFGSSLEEIMALQRDRFPEHQLPWIQLILSEEVLRLNGAYTEGIFRVPGDIDAVNQLKVRCETWDLSTFNQHQPSYLEDPHVPASLLKLWYRELADPLIPHDCYARALASHDNPVEAAAVVRDLPPLNRRCLTYLVRFLQVFAAPESASRTKMDVNNLAMVMAPNILRCTSLERSVIFENTIREMSYLRTLILHLDTTDLDGLV